MRIIYVDDEKLQLDNFRLTVEGMNGLEDLQLFSDSRKAYEWAKTHPVDVAFMDIEMPQINGIELAAKLKALNRDIRVIFVTGHGKYALDAFAVHASGYLLKPYMRRDIEEELEHAGFPVRGDAKKIQVCTMPDLFLTVNGRNVFTSHTKPEELFALLVDRGKSGITKGDAMACLWEGKNPTDSTYWTCLFRLKRILEDAGVPDLLLTNGNTKCLDITQIDCDLYRMLEGDPEVIRSYTGNYLRRYSWAEERVPQLDKIKENFHMNEQ